MLDMAFRITNADTLESNEGLAPLTVLTAGCPTLRAAVSIRR
jgi:hypothetical protein